MSERDIVIHPRRGSRELPVPPRAMLVVNPAEAEVGIELFGKMGAQARKLQNSNLLVNMDGTLCFAGPALGAPAAALVIEKLIALGAEEIVLLSCCGALDPSVEIGDVLLATEALSGEGVSRYYGNQKLPIPEARLLDWLRFFLEKQRVDWGEGSIWSTDAPYRESRSEMLLLRECFGIVGVDMEVSALYSIAAYRKIGMAALFIVSDELWHRSWQPGFNSRRFRAQSRNILENLIVEFSG